jgi:hypothetical protein
VGNDNVGDRNVGNGNIGNDNRGNDNTGDRNVGDRNVGNDNRGNDNNGNGNVGDRNQGNGHRGNDRGWFPNLGPYPTMAGLAVDLFNNYQRGVGTYKDAATRHDRAAERARQAGNEKAVKRHEAAAKHYRAQSEKLKTITKNKWPKGLHGYFNNRVQKISAGTGADRINRRTLRNPDGTPQRNADGTKKTEMKEGRGWRVKETLRRGLTKVSGASTVFGVGIDVASGISNGEDPAHAVGRAGSTAIVGAAAGAATQAALATAAGAALVPGPGTAVAIGIGVGLVASMAFAHTDIDNKIGDLAQSGAKKAWNGIKSLF